MDALEFPGSEGELDQLLEQYPQLPALHYFKSLLHGGRGETAAAEAEAELAARLDSEREVFAEYDRVTRQVSQLPGVKLIDLVPLFDGLQGSPLFFDECHPNFNGHSLITGEIVGVISGG